MYTLPKATALYFIYGYILLYINYAPQTDERLVIHWFNHVFSAYLHIVLVGQHPTTGFNIIHKSLPYFKSTFFIFMWPFSVVFFLQFNTHSLMQLFFLQVHVAVWINYQIQLTLERHWFELWSSTYRLIFFSPWRKIYCFHLLHGLGEGARVVIKLPSAFQEKLR